MESDREVISALLSLFLFSFSFLLLSKRSMKILISSSMLVILLALISGFIQANAAVEYFWCNTPGSRCYGKYVKCPDECPNTSSENPKAKVCYVNCNSPHCKPECKRKITIHLSLISVSGLNMTKKFRILGIIYAELIC